MSKNMWDVIFGAIGMGGNNNKPPQNNQPLPKPDINQPPVMPNMVIPQNPIPNPRMLNMPQGFLPVAKPFNIADQKPPLTLSDRVKQAGSGLLGNVMGLIDPKDQQQRMANLRFASKLAQLSRPQVGVTNRGIGATIGNVGEALEAYSEGMSPEIFQLGDKLVQLNPDGSITVLAEGSSDEVEENTLSERASSAELDDIDAIMTSTNMKNQAQNFIKQIDNNKLKFGLGRTFKENLQLALNSGDQELAINSQRFNTFISRLRNAQLRLAKGVQTEGDAQRAIDEFYTSIETNNTNAIRSALVSLVSNSELEISKRKRIIEIRRKNAKVPEFDFNQIALQSDSFASDVASADLGSLSAENQLKELGL